MAETARQKGEEPSKEALALAALYIKRERATENAALRLMGQSSFALVGDLSLRQPFDDQEGYAFADASGYRTIAARSTDLKSRLVTEFEAERAKTREAIKKALMAMGLFLFGQSAFRDRTAVAAKAKDALSAEAAANALKDAWAKAHASAMQNGSRRDFALARKLLKSKASTAAVFEVGSTFVDEMRRIQAVAAREGIDLVLTWSALLDSRTCGACKDRDGMVMTPNPNLKWPPLHANCRCTVIPKPARVH